MTDLEISKALALAIGWDDVFITASKCLVGTHDEPRNKVKINSYWLHGVRVFDYRDWNVIGPIAAKFDLFPVRAYDHKCEFAAWFARSWPCTTADTPQEAIALAVIGAHK